MLMYKVGCVQNPLRQTYCAKESDHTEPKNPINYNL